MTSFFICDDDWEKEKEVTLEEMDDNPEMDSWVMKETTISELVEDEKQKLYSFDYSSISALRDIKRLFNNRLMDYFAEKDVL